MRPATISRGRTAALLILTALPACDNVEWGGADVQVVPPPPPAGSEVIAPDAQTFADLGLPAGTVLFHVVRGADGAQVVPVAEVSGDSLRTLRRPSGVSPEAYEQRFRQAVLEPGSQLQLFRRGAPVGTLALGGAGPVTACGIPTATGSVTTVAAATDVGEFLAFRRGLEPEVRGEFTPPPITGSINTYANIVAEKLILQEGLPRPRSWAGARRDLQALEVARDETPEMAATYLVGDQLAVGSAAEEGYSVFYVADYTTRGGYTPFYSEVRDYRRQGKAAPRAIDHLNWNEAGGEDILVQVFGANESWYEAVSQDRGKRWSKVWEGPRCREAAERAE